MATIFNRLTTRYLLASDFGMVPNDGEAMAKNAIILHKMISISPFSHIIMDGIGNTYYIGHAPENRTYADCAYCIGLIDFRGVFECDHGVKLVTEKGYVGIHVQRTSGDSDVHLLNVTIEHEGGRDSIPHYRQNYTLLPNGDKDYTGHELDWDQDWGSYKISGLNMWGSGKITNINISGYPGNGMVIFGSTEIRFNGPKISVPGTFGVFNVNLTFIPDDPTVFEQGFDRFEYVRSDGSVMNNLIGGRLGGFMTVAYLAGNESLVGQHATATVYADGRTLFADSIVAEGVNNIGGCGGCSIFTTGNEANQCSLNFFRLGNSGGWGVCDSSLLKNRYLDLHINTAGEHFNDHSVSPPILRVGGFTNRNDPNAGSVLIGGYREGGTMALDQPNGRTLYLGGVYPDGKPLSGQGIIDSQFFGIYTQEWGASNGARFRVTMGIDGQLKSEGF
jgi:hypothetical protein